MMETDWKIKDCIIFLYQNRNTRFIDASDEIKVCMRVQDVYRELKPQTTKAWQCVHVQSWDSNFAFHVFILCYYYCSIMTRRILSACKATLFFIWKQEAYLLFFIPLQVHIWYPEAWKISICETYNICFF